MHVDKAWSNSFLSLLASRARLSMHVRAQSRLRVQTQAQACVQYTQMAAL